MTCALNERKYSNGKIPRVWPSLRGSAIFPIYFKLRGLLRQTNLGRLVMHKQFQAVAKRIFLHSPYQYPVTGQCAIATLLA